MVIISVVSDDLLSSHVLVAVVTAVVGSTVTRSNFRLTVVAIASSSALDDTALVEIVFFRLLLRLRGRFCGRWWLLPFHQRAALLFLLYHFFALHKFVLRLLNFSADDDLLRFSALFADNDRGLWS